MRKVIEFLLAAGLMVACAHGGQLDVQVIEVTTGTNAAAAVYTDNATIRGYITEVRFAPITVCTGDVAVLIVPVDTTFAATVIATNAATAAEVVFRPRVDGTTTAGAANTNDPPERYPVAGEAIRLWVGGCDATTALWRAWVKTETE